MLIISSSRQIRGGLTVLLRHAPLPLYQALLLDIFAPPIMTGLWWLMSKGKQAELGTTDDPAVQGWTESLGKSFLIVMYVFFFGLTIYTYWINPYKGPSAN
jgi:hypothetical protein